MRNDFVRNYKNSKHAIDNKRDSLGGDGVELITVLTARKLLILRMARAAKKAPLPIPLYVYCTKIFSRFDS